ncbi:Fc.00g012840.m01.CDS01 [Cosmosporella sp. VM-42]
MNPAPSEGPATTIPATSIPEATKAANLTSPVPVLLLKTKSTPGDSYEELLSAPHHDGFTFAPRFVPVLLHNFDDAGMAHVRQLLRHRQIGARPAQRYGGLIFTSQRAVEAFTQLVEEEHDDASWPFLQDVPVYSVGPATTRALRAVSQTPGLQIFGEHTGNGATLGLYILGHYGEWYRDRPTKPPLLFLVGEQRRDIIPRTLMNPALADDKRIQVTETVVYGTGVMESFPADFEQVLEETRDNETRWVVVFSPTGCESFLRSLGMLDIETGKVKPGARDGKTFITTIGPTTRDHLRTFDLEPDVVAEAPTPEGVLQGIMEHMSKQNRK